MVAQDETGGLVVSGFTPGDVAPDGTIGGAAIASFAYAGSADTHAQAFAPAAHMAALDPQASIALAHWLEITASLEDRPRTCGTPPERHPLVEPARRFARLYPGDWVVCLDELRGRLAGDFSVKSSVLRTADRSL
ncbi:hypothetical protein [Streptomyces sp. NPDC101393]|uniref:hypothetical protein n=1 Tax=Streptomyces sp. NPDC101393 TaxID=3366141 RepID=UPI0037FB9545